MLKRTLKAIGHPVWRRLRLRIDHEIDRQTAMHQPAIDKLSLELQDLRKNAATSERAIDELRHQVQSLSAQIDELSHFAQSLPDHFEKRSAEIFQQRTFVPPEPVLARSEPFMPHSTCSVLDMLHPRYLDILHDIDHPFSFHRKLWEWVFVIHHLQQAGMLSEGRRGLGFGIGLERLPALFAKNGCMIVATDAPPEIGVESGWSTSRQHSSALDDLRYPSIVNDDIFTKRVSHRFCDMNAISDDLTDFDFTWSSCCFEHLGSLEAGMQFVINSVEKTLKPGGIAVHTTEYNLSSNDDTIERGPTVFYRRRDMEELIDRLRSRGHDVQPFSVAPHAHPLDFHVDIPPFSNIPHLKLRMGKYAVTSVGVCVRRGPKNL